MESIINDEIKLSSLVRQQDTYQNSINTDRGRQERGINQSIKTILYQKHEVRHRLISVSRLSYFSVPAQFSLLSSVLLFVILIQEFSVAKPCCNFSFISIVHLYFMCSSLCYLAIVIKRQETHFSFDSRSLIKFSECKHIINSRFRNTIKFLGTLQLISIQRALLSPRSIS